MPHEPAPSQANELEVGTVRMPRSDVLTTRDHARDGAGLTYVYPVLSRRARGLSVGINLSINNACNWRCIYCQVPNLVRGGAPRVDLAHLERELRGFLTAVLHGDFLTRRLPAGMRRLNDVALSGNGEPTSAREFDAVVEVIGRVRRDLGVDPGVKTVLLTNGSLMLRQAVQTGVAALAQLNGEVWFKLDRATPDEMRAVNGTRASLVRVRKNLELAARLCRTWIQTCVFTLDGDLPSAVGVDAYLSFLAELRARGVSLAGIHLYGLARPSLQPEASRLGQVPEAWLHDLAARVRALGYTVQISP
jgi:wyosine [tRNA(Phe)-imidazoG37] synthetase (radical SAM superfamily)